MALTPRFAATTGAITLSLLLAACGGGETTPGDAGVPAAPTSMSSSSSAEAGTSVDAAHNEADVAFAQGMIVHHRGALEMAELAAARAESTEVRDLAARIAAAQGPEIETMSSWLQAWGEEVPEGMSMDGMAGMDHDGMDMGMGMEQSMPMLQGASGAEFDRMFLEMMIPHHQGAIEMSQTEQAEGENPQAVELAATIEADQSAEIEEMQQLLQTL